MSDSFNPEPWLMRLEPARLDVNYPPTTWLTFGRLTLHLLVRPGRCFNVRNPEQLKPRDILNGTRNVGLSSYISLALPFGPEASALLASPDESHLTTTVDQEDWNASIWQARRNSLVCIINNPAEELRLSSGYRLTIHIRNIVSTARPGVGSLTVGLAGFGGSGLHRQEFHIDKVPAEPKIHAFYTRPYLTRPGEPVDLNWWISGARNWVANTGDEQVKDLMAVSRETLAPSGPGSYELRLDGRVSRQAPVFMLPPEILTMEYTKNDGRLKWKCRGASRVSLKGRGGWLSIDVEGQKIMPDEERLTIKCEGYGSSVTRTLFPERALIPGFRLEKEVRSFINFHLLALKWDLGGLQKGRIIVSDDNTKLGDHLLEGPAGQWIHPFVKLPEIVVEGLDQEDKKVKIMAGGEEAS